MKKNLILILFIAVCLSANCQSNFKWDIKDSTPLSQAQLYAATKQFIAKTWNSAQNVIQNDDKESGQILVRSKMVKNSFFSFNDHIYTLGYTITFMMKEKKYRIVIDNVMCQRVQCGKYEWDCPPIAETYPAEKGLRITQMPEEKYLQLMKDIKNELQYIADAYTKELKKAPAASEW